MRSRALLFLSLLALTAALGTSRAPAAAAQGPLPSEGYRLVDTWTTRDPVSSIPKFNKPAGLDVASDETIFVVDSQLKQAYQLSNGGQVIRRWDVDAAVGVPLDVSVSNDRVVLVGDRGGEVRSRAGVLLRSFAIAGARGVSLGPDRRIYVSRLTQQGGVPTGVVEIRDIDGNVLGAPWQSDTFPIRALYGLDVGADGRVYVAGDGAVYVFKDGAVTALLRVRSNLEGPDLLDVSVDARGRVYGVLNSQGGVLVAWRGVAGTQGDYLGDAVVSGARALAAGPGAGVVLSLETPSFTGLGYVTDRDDLRGQVLQPLRWGEATDTLGQVDAPRRLATSPAGDLFIVDRVERVQRWNAAGDPQEQWDTTQIADVAGGAALPCYARGTALNCMGPSRTMAWTPDKPAPADGWLTAIAGNSTRVAVADMANQRIALYDRATGQAAGGFDLAPAGGYVAVGDLAMDESALYLANRSSHRVETRDFGGQVLASLEVPGDTLRLGVGGGHLYALSDDGWIYKYDGAGRLRAAFEAAPGGAPADLAVGPNGRVFVADFHLDEARKPVSRVLVYEPGGSPATQLPDHNPVHCTVSVDKRAAPGTVYLGDEIAVQLKVNGLCPPGANQMDVVLIVDQSGSMNGAAIAASQAAAVSFLAELDPKGAQVALVAFSTTSALLSPLTNDLRQVVRNVARIQAGGTTNYSPAMNLALAELTGLAARPEVPRIVVLMTDGQPTDRDDVKPTADRLKAAGLTLYTIGLGPDLDRTLLAGIASRPEYFYEAPSETQLSEIYRNIARAIGATKLLASGTVTDEIPADMRLVPGSALPQPEVQGRTLTWRLTDVPITGQALAYRLTPSQTGLRPTNVRATLDYVDSTAQTGSLVFPVPEVQVLRHSRYYAHLPYLSKNRCRPQRADVALVFDTSNSMLEPSAPGSAQNKLQAAILAGRAFMDNMILPGDQAAIVAFNGSAAVKQRLTGSRAALYSALAGMGTAGGTRIDLGLNAAAAELLSARHQAANVPVIVLLTDGLPSGTTPAEVVRAGSNARALGFAVYTIGLGEADMALLAAVAGSARRAYYSPTGAGLVDIYHSIAGQTLCD